MRKVIVGFLLLCIPFVIVLLLNIGNTLSNKYDYNFNPVNIGNAEWFLFWSAYLGGLATLVAFIKTIQYNTKSLKFQVASQEISDEAKFLAKLLADLDPRDIYNIYDKYMALPKDGAEINIHELKHVLHLLLDTQKKVRNNHLLLKINCSIYNESCRKCKSRKLCKRGKASIQFIENYDKMYGELYSALGHLHDLLSCRKNRVELFAEEKDVVEKMIQSLEKLQEENNRYNKAQTEIEKLQIMERIDSIKKLDTLLEARKNEIEIELLENSTKFESSSGEVLTFFKKIIDYEDNQINSLLISIQLFILAKKEVEEAMLKSKKVYLFELDQTLQDENIENSRENKS